MQVPISTRTLEHVVFKCRTAVITAVTTLTLVGCSDDPLGVNSGDPLTEDELQVVFYAIAGAFQGVGVGVPAGVGPALASSQLSESLNEAAECETDGTIGLNGTASGTVDEETFELDITYRLRLTPNGCTVPTEAGSITLDGAPYIQLDLEFFLSETAIQISGTESGGISFTSSDGRAGSCRFEVSFDGNVTLGTQEASSSVSGTVCGVSVSNLTIFELDEVA